MTHSLLEYCDNSCVTLKLLKLISLFPSKTRYSYYTALTHCELSFVQYWIINEKSKTEAFEWLFQTICENDYFTINDISVLLDYRNYTQTMLCDCIIEAEKRFGSIPKIEIAKTYCKQQ